MPEMRDVVTRFGHIPPIIFMLQLRSGAALEQAAQFPPFASGTACVI
jgi:hypothetical protein